MIYEKELKHRNELSHICKSIERLFGITLTLHEQMGLYSYYKMFSKNLKGKRDCWTEAQYSFMKDNFGLDVCQLGIDNIVDLWRIDVTLYPHKSHWDTPEFKEDCQNYAQKWRNQRELI